MDKSIATREVRDVLSNTFPEDVKVFRRVGNCYGMLGGVFVCFNIQHSRWKPEVGLNFCVNTSVLPTRLFIANPNGRFGKHPKEYDSHLFARGRLKEDPRPTGDHWFEPKSEQDFRDTLAQIRIWADRYWKDRVPEMIDDAWYVAQLRKMGDHPSITQIIALLEQN